MEYRGDIRNLVANISSIFDGVELTIREIRQVKFGGLLLSPVEKDDTAPTSVFAHVLVPESIWFHTLDNQIMSSGLVKGILEPIFSHPNVTTTATDLSAYVDELTIMSAGGISAIFSEMGFAFDVNLSRSAQEYYFASQRWDKTSESSSIHVHFDGMIFMSSVIVNDIDYNSTHGQVVREFLRSLYRDSITFDSGLHHISPTPLREEFFVVFLESPAEVALDGLVLPGELNGFPYRAWFILNLMHLDN